MEVSEEQYGAVRGRQMVPQRAQSRVKKFWPLQVPPAK
jgi:hypothetical protein